MCVCASLWRNRESEGGGCRERGGGKEAGVVQLSVSLQKKRVRELKKNIKKHYKSIDESIWIQL